MASLPIEKATRHRKLLSCPRLPATLKSTTRHSASLRRKRFCFATCSRVTTQPGRNQVRDVRLSTTTFDPANIISGSSPVITMVYGMKPALVWTFASRLHGFRQYGFELFAVDFFFYCC